MLNKFEWKTAYTIVLILNAIYIFVFYLIMFSNK